MTNDLGDDDIKMTRRGAIVNDLLSGVTGDRYDLLQPARFRGETHGYC